jgi:phytoene synthase
MAILLAEDRYQRAADLAACRALLRSGSHSFHLASKLLPPRVAEAATALYAFCRLADDAIDIGCTDSRAALAQLQAQLDRVYAGRPLPQPVERLLTWLVEEYAIPRTLLDAVLDGFAWDSAGRRYQTITELNAYAARVAGSVGALMTLLMGVRSHAVLARACELGVAMQLTNIARDVGQDARAGRVYLPIEWLSAAGIDPDRWLAEPQFSPALGAIIERLLRVADELYARATNGISGLPVGCRPGIHAARLLYADIGNDLRRHGRDPIARRAHVALGRKLQLLGLSLWAAMRPAPALAHAPLEETRFLVEAVETSTLALRSQDGAREAGQGRAEWVLELFERLQERDQLRAVGEGAGR